MVEVKLSDKNKQLLRELIKNPRCTDVHLSALLGVSQPTVARQRAKLEKAGVLRYLVHVDNSQKGLGSFSARKLYVIRFNQGVTRNQVASVTFRDVHKNHLFNKHIYSAHLGDSAGKVCLFLMLESRVRGDFVDIVNGEVIPFFKVRLGEYCVHDIVDYDIEETLRLLHNYDGDGARVVDEHSIYVAD